MSFEHQFYHALKNSLQGVYGPEDIDLICTEIVTLMKSTEPESFSTGMAMVATYNRSLMVHVFVARCYSKYFDCGN